MSGIKKKQVVTIYFKTNTHDGIKCKRIIQGILRAIDRFAENLGLRTLKIRFYSF